MGARVSRTDLVASFEKELSEISRWWHTHALDQEQGGFYGRIDDNNLADRQSAKGIIQNARILWYFSEVAIFRGRAEDRTCAERAYAYISEHFIDPRHGGVFWELDYRGQLTNGRKQIYAQAFALYAFCAYHRLTGNTQALEQAHQLFDLIETYGRDRERGGYLEAFSRDWSPIEDLRLSPKDMNWPKTMNTHLHVLEAYTALFVTQPCAGAKLALQGLVQCFAERFVHPSGHLRMFLDVDWQDKSDCYSYGHDIECSWLLWEAVEALRDQALAQAIRPHVLGLAQACLFEGLAEHGEMLDAYDFISKQVHPERVWWVQAEAMVGFLSAYDLTGIEDYFIAFERLWCFIQEHQIDRQCGEWRWLSALDQNTRFSDQKAGPWKGPYHNGRAMMEVLRRLSSSSD